MSDAGSSAGAQDFQRRVRRRRRIRRLQVARRRSGRRAVRQSALGDTGDGGQVRLLHRQNGRVVDESVDIVGLNRLSRADRGAIAIFRQMRRAAPRLKPDANLALDPFRRGVESVDADRRNTQRQRQAARGGDVEAATQLLVREVSEPSPDRVLGELADMICRYLLEEAR